jgi:hypothetical protein
MKCRNILAKVDDVLHPCPEQDGQHSDLQKSTGSCFLPNPEPCIIDRLPVALNPPRIFDDLQTDSKIDP